MLDNPSSAETPVNVTSIAEFVKHLRDLRLQHGYELQNIYNGCLELYKAVWFATKTSQYTMEHDDTLYPRDNEQSLEVPFMVSTALLSFPVLFSPSILQLVVLK